MTTEVNAQAPIAVTGETWQVLAGTAIPDRCIAVDVIIVVPGAQGKILRITAVEDMAGGPRITCVDSVVPNQPPMIYMRPELEMIRPLGFVIPDRPWYALSGFVEGGLYQAWPNGRLFRVRNRHLVDAYTNARIHTERDRTKLPAMIPVFVQRWPRMGMQR